jgi:hypothetical protein
MSSELFHIERGRFCTRTTHTASSNDPKIADNRAENGNSPDMMYLPFDSFEVGSQCSAEVVLPNMPLRGRTTSRSQWGCCFCPPNGDR